MGTFHSTIKVSQLTNIYIMFYHLISETIQQNNLAEYSSQKTILEIGLQSRCSQSFDSLVVAKLFPIWVLPFCISTSNVKVPVFLNLFFLNCWKCELLEFQVKLSESRSHTSNHYAIPPLKNIYEMSTIFLSARDTEESKMNTFLALKNSRPKGDSGNQKVTK